MSYPGSEDWERNKAIHNKLASKVSSNINIIGYDEELRQLHVKFNNGAEYVYEDVSSEVFNEFLAADSAGRYLNEHIKGKYESRKIS